MNTAYVHAVPHQTPPTTWRCIRGDPPLRPWDPFEPKPPPGGVNPSASPSCAGPLLTAARAVSFRQTATLRTRTRLHDPGDPDVGELVALGLERLGDRPQRPALPPHRPRQRDHSLLGLVGHQ